MSPRVKGAEGEEVGDEFWADKGRRTAVADNLEILY